MRHIFASLPLDNKLTRPIYQQISLRIKDAIIQGVLAPNSRLPSLRGLASELGVARATVENAYSILIAEGFLQSRGQAGTYVLPQSLKTPRPVVSIAGEPVRAIMPTAFYSSGQLSPFQLGLPALDVFPHKVWLRIVARQLRSMTTTDLRLPPANGLVELREAICRYLHLSRDLVCHPEQIFICAGYQALMGLIINTLLQPGDQVWLEDPGYPTTHPLLTLAGMRPIPVPVDDRGMNIATGMTMCPDARMAVLTPTHQSPLGVSLSLERRMALLDWAQQHASWIIEDDYDSEFRYHGRPLPPLKRLDRQGRVLYAGTFSKTLFPALRLAYLMVPPEQIDAFATTCQLHVCGCPPLMQAGVADFINQGHFYRHLKRMRLLYLQRREWLVTALEQQSGELLMVAPQAGGIQLLARLKSGLNDKEVVRYAWQRGMAVQALSDWQRAGPAGNGLLMGFTNFKNKTETEQAVANLIAAIQLIS